MAQSEGKKFLNECTGDGRSFEVITSDAYKAVEAERAANRKEAIKCFCKTMRDLCICEGTQNCDDKTCLKKKHFVDGLY